MERLHSLRPHITTPACPRIPPIGLYSSFSFRVIDVHRTRLPPAAVFPSIETLCRLYGRRFVAPYPPKHPEPYTPRTSDALARFFTGVLRTLGSPLIDVNTHGTLISPRCVCPGTIPHTEDGLYLLLSFGRLMKRLMPGTRGTALAADVTVKARWRSLPTVSTWIPLD